MSSKGRKPGYKHSEKTKEKIRKSLKGVPHSPHLQETKEKIRESLTGRPQPQETRDKIRESLRGKPHPEERKESIAQGKSLYELDEKCIARYEDLKANYPGQEDFFLDHQDELLFAMRDVRTEKELTDIRRYVETAALRPDEPYQYNSSSCYAAEDAMIALLDFKRLMGRYPLSTNLI
jgi:hypothetical protein